MPRLVRQTHSDILCRVTLCIVFYFKPGLPVKWEKVHWHFLRESLYQRRKYANVSVHLNIQSLTVMRTPWASGQIWHHHKWPIFCSCVYESLPLIPYVELSDAVRRICRQYNIRTLFQSASTLCGWLMQVKDQDPLEKHSNVVYKVPCSCGWVYIGETKRALETRVKEHKPDTRRGELKNQQLPNMPGVTTSGYIGTRLWRW